MIIMMCDSGPLRRCQTLRDPVRSLVIIFVQYQMAQMKTHTGASIFGSIWLRRISSAAKKSLLNYIQN